MTNKIIPIYFTKSPTLCPKCYTESLKLVDQYNNKLEYNKTILEKNQKYYLFCMKCYSYFHITWNEDNEPYPVLKEDNFNEFLSTYLKEQKQ